MTIVFRSHTFDRIHSGTGSKISRTRGADWENIRPYQNDDIRDIIWNKTTSDSLFIRERHDQSGLHILCIVIRSEGDEFYLRSPHESKSEYIKKAEQSIKKASESHKHTYEYRMTTSLENI